MTQFLIELGHQSIGFLSGPLNQTNAQKRREGFLKALYAADIEPNKEWIREGDFSYLSGLSYGEYILSKSDRPSAVFASNDEMAAGCLAAAYKNNVSVPNDLSIAGFDNSDISQVFYPQITTVSLPIFEMAEEAVYFLRRLSQQPQLKCESIQLNRSIVIKSSTGPN